MQTQQQIQTDTYIVEDLLGLPDLHVFNGVSCHPAAATDPFQISLVHILKTEIYRRMRRKVHFLKFDTNLVQLQIEFTSLWRS